MRVRVTVLAGAAAAIGAVAARVFRRRSPVAAPDPRADELRQRLHESRAVVSEREEFEAAETPVDQVEPVAEGDDRRREVEERRREIHDRARSAAEEMRGGDQPG